ncbi:hypothetical protein D3C75_1314850 [compost metagenome]
MMLKVFRRGDHHQFDFRPDRYGNHVFFYPVIQADPGIELLSDNVHQLVIGGDLHFYVRIFAAKSGDYRQ